MEISCILLATAKRLDWLDKSIKSIDSLDFKFIDKVLSVDEFDGHKLREDTLLEYRNNGWIVDLVSFKNKHLSLKKAVDVCSGDYIFYTEDDIVLKFIPKDIIDIINLKDKSRTCGLLSMNLGGSLLDYPKHLGDLPKWIGNTIIETENSISFIRDESMRSRWFFEFPCVFICKDILDVILKHPIISNNNIEEVLTERFFFNNLQDKYFKASICNTEIKTISTLLLNNTKVPFWIEKLESTKFYRILDNNQGGAHINLEQIKQIE